MFAVGETKPKDNMCNAFFRASLPVSGVIGVAFVAFWGIRDERPECFRK